LLLKEKGVFFPAKTGRFRNAKSKLSFLDRNVFTS